MPGNLIRDLHLDSWGRFWVATSDGGLGLLVEADDSFQVFRPEEGNDASIGSLSVMGVTEDPQGNLYFACWGTGVSRWIEGGPPAFDTWVIPEENRIYAIDARDQGIIRMGTWGGGLLEFDPANRILFRYRADERTGTISHDVVYSLFLDSRGTYWVGTNGGGVNQLESDGSAYKIIAHQAGKPASLPAGKVTSIMEDREGRIWVGQYNGGLSLLDPQGRLIRSWLAKDGDPRSLGNNIVNTIFQDSEGIVWVGTNNGLSRYVPATDDFTTYRYREGDPGSLGSDIIYALAEDDARNLWIGTYATGLEYWDRRTGRFSHFPSRPGSDTHPGDNLVYALRFDARGNLWIGMNTGLDRYRDGTFTHYRYDTTQRGGIPGSTVRALLLDSRQQVWIATIGGGVARYDPSTDGFVHFGKAEGLPDHSVKSLVEDQYGTIWAGTARGIALMGAGSQNFRQLLVYHGLRDRDFHTGALVTGKGDLWFGGASTLYRINPTVVAREAPVPQIRISRIRIGANAPPTILGAPRTTRVDLPWQDNSFSISLAVLDYQDGHDNSFTYLLDGFDRTWRIAGNNAPIDYSNLPGGTYTLRVKTQAVDGSWDDQTFVLPVHVQTPPWLSPGAWVSYFALLVGLGYLIAALRGKQRLWAKVQELTRLKAELEQANEKLAENSLTDPLTGLSNRRHMDAMVPLIYADAQRKKTVLSILMLDVDHFKDFNDTQGHLEGDRVLQGVAEAIKACTNRATDLVVRFGGEEFLTVLPHTPSSGAWVVAQRIVDLCRNTLPVTVSVGIYTLVPSADISLQEAIHTADRMLFRAKNSGRDCIVADQESGAAP